MAKNKKKEDLPLMAMFKDAKKWRKFVSWFERRWITEGYFTIEDVRLKIKEIGWGDDK